MSRAGWSGGGDYSGFFGSLYGAGKAQRQAEQDAADSDMADKWQNGLVSDDEWLAYIRERIDAEADPKRNERWVEALRKYSVVIADSQAEFAYENGGSIGGLISYYEGRLKTLVKDSNEYRDVASKLNQLKDKRASEDITTGSEAIVSKIKLGKASYQDLIDFYAKAKKGIRKGSDLLDQLDSNIQDVKDKIASDKIEGDLEMYQYQFKAGKLSAAGFAKKIREIAGTFKNSDPQRYWSLLQSALGVSKSGSGGSGGSGGGRSSSATKAINATIDSLQAQLSYAETIGKQYEEGRTYALDPVTGATITLNSDTIHGIDTQVLDSFDALALAYDKKGDASAAQNVRNRKTKYIVGPITTHNTIDSKEQERQLVLTTGKSLEFAASHPDPEYAMGIVRNVAERWAEFSKATTQNATHDPNFAGDPSRRLPTEEEGTTYTPKGITEQVDPDYASGVWTIATALQTIADENLTEVEYEAARAALNQTFGAESDIGRAIDEMLVKPATTVRGNKEGLALGQVEPVVFNGKTIWVPKVTVSRTVIDPETNRPTTIPVPVYDEGTLKELTGGAYDDAEKTPIVDVIIDVNGFATPRKAIATQESAGWARTAGSNITVKLNGKETTLPAGAPIPDTVWQAMSEIDRQTKVELVPAYTYLTTTVDGEKWVQDPSTKVWYQGQLPIKYIRPTGMVGPDGQPIVGLNDAGKADIDYEGMADYGGVPAPYSGKDLKGAQSLAESGAIDTSNLRVRDINGDLDPTRAYDVTGKFYNPIQGMPTYLGPTSAERRRSESEAKIKAAQQEYLGNVEQGGAKRANLFSAKGPMGNGGIEKVFTEIGSSIGINFGTEDKGGLPLPAKKAVGAGSVKIALPESVKADVPKTFSGPKIAKVVVAPTKETKITVPTPVKRNDARHSGQSDIDALTAALGLDQFAGSTGSAKIIDGGKGLV